jgi:hypothetical protein
MPAVSGILDIASGDYNRLNPADKNSRWPCESMVMVDSVGRKAPVPALAWWLSVWASQRRSQPTWPMGWDMGLLVRPWLRGRRRCADGSDRAFMRSSK